jgi:hypothetical protein
MLAGLRFKVADVEGIRFKVAGVMFKVADVG